MIHKGKNYGIKLRKYNFAPQPNIAETTFSVVKRKLRETIRARKYHNKGKEIKFKAIVYTISKKAVEIICIRLRISTEPIIYILSSSQNLI